MIPTCGTLRGLSILTWIVAWSCLVTAAGELRGANPPATVKLVFVGDIMMARDEETGKLIERGLDPFKPFAGLLNEADFAVGNLECVIAEKGKPLEKPFHFLADPRCIPLLKKHFAAVTVANNHSEDFGEAAFVEQCERLERADLPYFGGGRTRTAARKPWVVEHNGVRIAVLGYDDVYSPTFEAQENRPGVARSDDDDSVCVDIRAARDCHQADIVIAFMHWGWQYRPTTERQMQLARRMIDAGVDAVVGAHPHVTQGAEHYKGRPIVYSLGNFLFSGFDKPQTRIGWALRLTVDKHGIVAWDTIVAQLDDHGAPHPRFDLKSPSGRDGTHEVIERAHTQ
jgi:poly-gamma-glutamate synthesis protein (capsule biosynthesis protein)